MTGCSLRIQAICVSAVLLAGCGPNKKDLMTFLKKGNDKMAWVKQCGDIPNFKLPGESSNLCWTKYERVGKKSGKVVLFVGARMNKNSDDRRLVLAVPPGVNMDKGVRVKFDKEPPLKFNYSHCENRFCIAEAPLTNRLLIKLKYSKQMVVAVMTNYGKAYGFKVPLYRFVYAYNSKPKRKELKTANNNL